MNRPHPGLGGDRRGRLRLHSRHCDTQPSAFLFTAEPESRNMGVVDPPEVRYARSGNVNIAYSVVGDGPFDVVFVSGWILSNLDVAWQGPAAEFFLNLASFSRLIL